MATATTDDLASNQMVPILYNKCARYSGFAKFDIHKIQTSAASSSSSVEIKGECSQVDHVFCGTHKDPDYSSQVSLLHGELFQVYGGSLESIDIDQQESGDKVTLRVSYDGTSPEILIIYGTKEKNS